MSYHPDTDDYLIRLASAGGTISQFNTNLLDTKIRYIYANNLRGATDFLKYWLCLNLTESFTGCLVPVYDDGVGTATNNNFVSGDWSATLGLTPNGSTKYLNSNYSLPASLGSFTLGGRSDFHMGVWQSDFVINPFDYECNMGVFFGDGGGSGTGSQNAWTLENGFEFDDSNFTSVGRDGYSAPSASPCFGTGFLLLNQVSTGSSRLLGNNSLRSATSGSPSFVRSLTNNVFLFARNNDGSPDLFSTNKVTNFTMGYGLSTSQETALYDMLNITEPTYYASPLMLMAC